MPSRRSAAAQARAEALRPILEPLAAQGAGVRLMAQALAREGVVGPSGLPLHPKNVRDHLARLGIRTAAHAQRISAGLQRAQARGVPIGNSPGAVAAREARAAAAAAWAESVRDQLEQLTAAGLGWGGIAQALNAAGVTRDGQPVKVGAVRAALRRLGISTARSRRPDPEAQP